jgi:hypothetical protein
MGYVVTRRPCSLFAFATCFVGLGTGAFRLSPERWLGAVQPSAQHIRAAVQACRRWCFTTVKRPRYGSRPPRHAVESP